MPQTGTHLEEFMWHYFLWDSYCKGSFASNFAKAIFSKNIYEIDWCYSMPNPSLARGFQLIRSTLVNGIN